MKTYVNKTTFINELSAKWFWFSYDWADILFEYLEQLEDEIEQDIDYDPIAFRCQYTEYDLNQFMNDYPDVKKVFKEYLIVKDSEDNEEIRQEFYEDEIEMMDGFIWGNWPDCFIVDTEVI